MTWTGDPRTSTSQWKKLRLRILERDGRICGICGKPGADTVDHIIPYGSGGSDHPSNLRAIHDDPCHRFKTAAEGVAARTKKYNRARPAARHPGLRDPRTQRGGG